MTEQVQVHRKNEMIRQIKQLWRLFIQPTALRGKLLERAGIEDLTLHDLRGFIALAGLSAGSTLEGVGQLLRHKNMATTKGYAFLKEDAARAAANAASDAVIKRVGRGD